MENQAFSNLPKKISRKGFIVMFNFRQISVFHAFRKQSALQSILVMIQFDM